MNRSLDGATAACGCNVFDPSCRHPAPAMQTYACAGGCGFAGAYVRPPHECHHCGGHLELVHAPDEPSVTAKPSDADLAWAREEVADLIDAALKGLGRTFSAMTRGREMAVRAIMADQRLQARLPHWR